MGIARKCMKWQFSGQAAPLLSSVFTAQRGGAVRENTLLRASQSSGTSQAPAPGLAALPFQSRELGKVLRKRSIRPTLLTILLHNLREWASWKRLPWLTAVARQPSFWGDPFRVPPGEVGVHPTFQPQGMPSGGHLESAPFRRWFEQFLL